MRWRWSWLSAVWLIFFANVKLACCSGRIIGAWTPTFKVSRRYGLRAGLSMRSMASVSGHSAGVSPTTARYASAISRERARRKIDEPRRQAAEPRSRNLARKLRHRARAAAIPADLPSARCRNGQKTAHPLRALARPFRRSPAALRRACRSPPWCAKTVQHDSGNGVHHRGEGRDRQHVSRHFNRALFGLAFDFLRALRMRHRADVPDVAQNFARRRREQLRQLAVMVPRARNRLFVDRALFGAEVRVLGDPSAGTYACARSSRT